MNLDDFFACQGCQLGCNFFLSFQAVNSKGYLEFDQPIRALLQCYPLFQCMLNHNIMNMMSNCMRMNEWAEFAWKQKSCRLLSYFIPNSFFSLQYRSKVSYHLLSRFSRESLMRLVWHILRVGNRLHVNDSMSNRWD